MGFRNRIVRLSQLIADRIVGAYIATAESGLYWILSNSTNQATIEAVLGVQHGTITVEDNGTAYVMRLTGPMISAPIDVAPQIILQTDNVNNLSIIQLVADQFNVTTDVVLGEGVSFNNTSRIRGVSFGNATVVVLNGAITGTLSFAHNLGFTPLAVFCIPSGTSSYVGYIPADPGGANMQVGVRKTDGVAVGANTNVKVWWLAIG